MKKLLQINVTANLGSTGRIVENLGAIAMKNGWESYVACRDFNESSSKIIKVGNKFDFYSHVIQTRILDNHGFASIVATKKLIKEIEEIQPTIIHLHNLHGYYLNITVLFNFLKKVNVPIFWTLYDCWSFTGHCSYYDIANCDKWKTECNNCPNKKEYPKSVFLDQSKKNFNKKRELFKGINNLKLIVNSNWLKNELEESFLSEYPKFMIHNGINIEDFKRVNTSKKRNELNLDNKFVILGIASEWNKRKGLDDIVKLSKKLSDDEVIVIDGLTDKQRAHMPNKIIALDRAKSINELVVLYSMSDVFINTTFEDNFPTTNLEALACGTPVITYNSGGSPEAIDVNAGYVVEKGNVDELLLKICELKKVGSHKYTDSCVQRAGIEFNHLKNYQQIINLYKSNQ